MDEIEKLEKIKKLSHDIDDLVISFEGDKYHIANNLSGGFITLKQAINKFKLLQEDE